ncbi:Gfo/Idh/MocA family protein [Acetivibrio cellulolyticus]|uniref:Gfo/Idh/MocA family protein n=1 Tax=Acetivibrio cellulolyticus TaxID=35830 RepID=UPI0001E2F0A4|nr:Gfo/Idh/MocA family oxidoreductase [Acetivibrio cellulolyticus]
MTKNINWGIMGCGGIAREFADALKAVEGANLIAAASKSGKAKQFAEDFNLAYYYDDYEEFVRNEEIDVVYVATTHNFHYENTMLCLNNNKHVLCEKAFTLNAKQASRLIEIAKSKKLFLMEAMWTRFSPALAKLISVIKAGVIGEIKTLKGDFCIDVPFDPKHRLYNINLAGGSLLDLGIYPITFACMILERYPVEITGTLNIGKTSVDQESHYLLKFDKGETALLSSACTYSAPIDFVIYGTKGRIVVPNFYFPAKLILMKNGKTEEIISVPYESNGKNYEAIEVMECILQNKTQSDKQTFYDTLKIMEILDSLREAYLTYPNENDF